LHLKISKKALKLINFLWKIKRIVIDGLRGDIRGDKIGGAGGKKRGEKRGTLRTLRKELRNFLYYFYWLYLNSCNSLIVNTSTIVSYIAQLWYPTTYDL